MTAEHGRGPEQHIGAAKMGPQGWEASRWGQRTTDGEAVVSPMRVLEQGALDAEPTEVEGQIKETTQPETQSTVQGGLIVDLGDLPVLPRIKW